MVSWSRIKIEVGLHPMILFGHIGPSALAANGFTKSARFGKKEFLLVCFFAILPDIIDKSPLYLFGIKDHTAGHMIGHTLIFSLLLCTVCFFRFRALWPWVLATPGHLLLDLIKSSPATLFWPLLGNFPAYPFPDGHIQSGLVQNLIWDIQHSPVIKFIYLPMELIGLCCLAIVFVQSRKQNRLHQK